MSLDLYERDISERMSGLRPITAPTPGAFDNFLYSAGTAAMRTFASAGRAVTMAAGGVASAVERIGAMHPLSDGAVDTRLSDAVWRVHDDLTQRAVDYWTPNPNEVGVAGQVVGQLLATLPMVVASPSALVAATQLGTAEDVMRKGVDADKAQAVGAVQAAGLGLGIWMPILGQNLWQRVVLGGAGFNVVQGAATRGISGEILEGTPAAEEFKAFDPQALTLDVLLGAAFGGVAHLSPSQRAQGREFIARLKSWGQDLKPSDVDALQVLRQAQHMNVDSMPGKPVDVQDIEAHVQRVKAAIDQLAGDRPVQVDDLPAPRVEPNAARTAEQQANLSVLQELGERVRRLERIPLTPDEITARAESIGTRIANEIQSAGRSPEEAQAVGKVWGSFFSTAAKVYGVDPQQLFETYGARVQAGTEVGPGALRQIPPDVVRTFNTPIEMPVDPIFAESVRNTPGAEVTPDGLRIDLVRFQKEEQEAGRAVRTGVFYLPAESPQAKGYKGANKAYGGTERYQGETVLRRPLFVKGATGGKAPEAAYDQIKGKGAYDAMRTEVLANTRRWAEPRSTTVDRIEALLEKYGADPMLAFDIVENSRAGNTLPYAIQENIVAHAVREAGYDAVVGFSKGKSGNRISEVFDVRELTYPSNVTGPDIHEKFLQPAYHGSPHTFDKFSTEKIGTGEGAQAYGWGLYFAENKGIADSYRKSLSPRGPALLESALKVQMDEADALWAAARVAAGDLKSSMSPESLLEARSASMRKRPAEERARLLASAIEVFKKEPGALYQVDIPDEAVARMLDWDKPLSEQAPSVREALAKIGIVEEPAASREDIEAAKDAVNKNRTKKNIDALHRLMNQGRAQNGAEIYKRLAYSNVKPGAFPEITVRNDEAASKALAAAGIPGIKYLDASSRGQGTRVFDADGNRVDVSGDSLTFANGFDSIDSAIAEANAQAAKYPNMQRIAEELASWKSKGYELREDVTRNLVVFDDKHVTITHKDGTPVTAQERAEFLQSQLPGGNQARGAIEFGKAETLISVFKNADESTLIHESGHFFLQVTKDLASRADAPEGALNDWSTLALWLKNEGGELTRAQQEQFARGFEAYMGSGEAPTPALKGVFDRFKDWLLNIYKSLTSLDVKLSDDVRAVMGRMLSDETEARPAPRPAEPPRSMAEEQGGAEVREGETPDPLAYAAERIANERPDLAFTIGRDADGNPVTTTVRQYLDDVRADVAAAMDDARLFEAAAVCLLGKG